MHPRDRIATALGWSTVELSVLCLGAMTAIALYDPHGSALIASIIALDCAVLCMAYRRRVWFAWRLDSYIAATAMRMWLFISLGWLAIAL